MGLLGRAQQDQTSFYGRLTRDEKARMHPCTRAKCVMRSGDSSPPLRASIPSAYDVPDDAGITVTSRATRSSSSSSCCSLSGAAPMTTANDKPPTPESEAEGTSIEEAFPIVRKTLPSPEPRPKIEKNGFDRKYADRKKLVDDFQDDPCIVKCVYFTQQCCECTIL